MTRTMDGDVSTALQQSNLRAHYLTYFDFGSGALRFWDGVSELTISTGGDADGTYTATGILGQVGGIEESTDLKATGAEFTLSGIPSDLLSVALTEQYQGRTATCWLAIFNVTTDALITDPFQIFSGRMNLMPVTDAGKTGAIVVTAESRLIDTQRSQNPRVYTNQDQQNEHAGDLGLEFVPKMQELVITWGRKDLAPSIPGDEAASELPASPPPAPPPPDPVFDDDGGGDDGGWDGLDDNDTPGGGWGGGYADVG